jgi:hypothetical protein
LFSTETFPPDFFTYYFAFLSGFGSCNWIRDIEGTDIGPGLDRPRIDQVTGAVDEGESRPIAWENPTPFSLLCEAPLNQTQLHLAWTPAFAGVTAPHSFHVIPAKARIQQLWRVKEGNEFMLEY